MGPTEFWGKWEVRDDRILVHGTKRAGRERFIPRFTTVIRPAVLYPAFRRALAKHSALKPYDLRRTYANWLESAGIPRTRRKLYLGHGSTDVTSLYEWHEVEQFIAEDRAKLAAYVFGATAKAKLRLVNKA
jgi:integrase